MRLTAPLPTVFRPTALTLLTLLTLLACSTPAEAQLGKRLQRAAQRGAERALERNADRKTGEAVDKVFEKPDKSSKRRGRDEGGGDAGAEVDRSERARANGRGGDGGGAAGSDGGGGAPSGPAFSMTSKYDFEPGARILHYDDFSRASVGDLPTGYNTLGGLEVFTTSTAPGKWVRINSTAGQVAAFDFAEFPQNFTLEFDVIVDVPAQGYRYKGEFGAMLTSEGDPEASLNTRLEKVGKRNIVFWIDRDISKGFWKAWEKNVGGEKTKGNAARIDDVVNDATRGQVHRVSLWRQGKRMRMYLNDRKAFDIPLAWSGDEPIRGLRFIGQYSDASDGALVSNIRLAEGAPDTRSKLETEGKLTTYGITFASGADEVEPRSAGTLKRIAQVLKANPDMRLRITGHTDADGSEASNQELSERRAASVKRVLTMSYGIGAARLETAGRGESDPVTREDTPAAKAMNRRVVLEVI